jgi:hypothetical protein
MGSRPAQGRSPHRGVRGGSITGRLAAQPQARTLPLLLVACTERGVNGQVIRANGVIGGQNQGHGPGISTGAMHGEKRQAHQGNINFWRSS